MLNNKIFPYKSASLRDLSKTLQKL